MSENISVSIGELWDKYSILLIKKEKIKDKLKLDYVNNEIKSLDKIMRYYPYQSNELFKNLKKVNEKLWDIEDKLRIKESLKTFDNEFIELARSVYYTNDERAEIKRNINIIYDSLIHEIKDYINYK
jgi:CII-binding regulator of phage lambda lysogenization HflD